MQYLRLSYTTDIGTKRTISISYPKRGLTLSAIEALDTYIRTSGNFSVKLKNSNARENPSVLLEAYYEETTVTNLT